jgi:putative FmdB family regulatory protein
MPIYEYQCQQCGHHHEALQKLSDSQLRKCPECGRSSLKRLVSAVRFRLAGSGWYETDFKSDKEGKRNLHEKGDKDEPKPEAKPDAKPEVKPEVKPEAKGDASAADKAEAKPSTASESGERKSRTVVTKPSARPSSASPARRKPKAAARKPAARRVKR